MDLERYAPTPFGEARRTPGRHGYVAYFPAPIPHVLDLPPSTVRELADAEAALGQLTGSGRLVPISELLIRPYLLREALASTRIEGTQATMAEVFETDAAGGPSNAEEVVSYVAAMQWGLEQLGQLPLSTRLLCEMHRRLMAGVRARELAPGKLRSSQNWIGAAGSTIETAQFVPPLAGELPGLLSDWERFAHEEGRAAAADPETRCSIRSSRRSTRSSTATGDWGGCCSSSSSSLGVGSRCRCSISASTWSATARATTTRCRRSTRPATRSLGSSCS